MNEAVLYQTKNGKVAISGDTPKPGDEMLIIPQADGSYITSGPYPKPEPGDEGLMVQTENGPAYVGGGVLKCENMGESYWNWYQAGIDSRPWQGQHINLLEILWSSKEFKAIRFDIYFIGHLKITAFGRTVLDMLSPTDANGWAVEYHIQQTYLSDNPCGFRAVRLQLEAAGIMTFATLRGAVYMHVGRNGDITPATEVILI